MADGDFAWDALQCAAPGCRQPAPYRLWRGDQLLAHHCPQHHSEWWNSRDLALHQLAEAAAALEEAPAPAWTAGVEWHDGQYWPDEPIPQQYRPDIE